MIPGHADAKQSSPFSLTSASTAGSSPEVLLRRTTGFTPKNGSAALPGLEPKAPGMVEIKTPPASVCHQVSTIGQRSCPT